MTLVLALLLASVPPAPEPRAERSLVEAGFGKGVTVQTSDGSFAANARARVQVQGATSFPEPGGDPAYRTDQALVRRARIALSATYRDVWQLYVQLGMAPLDLDPVAPSIVRDASIVWTGLRDLNVRAGQMKVPFDRQRLISSSSLQFVDRSLVVTELNLDRDVGLQLSSDDFLGLGGRFHYAVGVFGGDGRNRVSSLFGLLYAARLTYRPFGRFEEREADHDREPSPKLALAIAGARNVNSQRERSTIGPVTSFGTFDHWHATADALLKFRGFSFLGETVMRRADRATLVDDTGAVVRSSSAWGYLFQAGYLFLQQWEAAARFGELRPLGRLPGPAATREMGAAVSWYAMRHHLKVQADYHYLTFPGGPLGRHLARLQAQLYF